MCYLREITNPYRSHDKGKMLMFLCCSTEGAVDGNSEAQAAAVSAAATPIAVSNGPAAAATTPSASAAAAAPSVSPLERLDNLIKGGGWKTCNTSIDKSIFGLSVLKHITKK